MHTHTIFGAGQVGSKLAEELLAAGHAVRIVRRSAGGTSRPNLTWMRGDLTDRDFADAACRDADVVYNCANPPYGNWDGVIQPMFRAVLDAASRANARLVVLDNLYMYGAPGEQPFTEDTPFNPCSHKGELRAALAEELFAAHHRGDVRVTSGRAPDFFGPETPNTAVFRARFFELLNRGRAVEVPGDPDVPHAYAYTPDVARGLAVLGTHEEALGRPWHLPVTSQTSTRELVERFARSAGVEPKIRALPRWVFTLLGLFSPLVRSAGEMVYQWERPFLVDDTRFRSTFDVGPTDVNEAVATTLESIQK